MKIKIQAIIITMLSLIMLTAAACGSGETEPEYGIVRNGNNIKLILPDSDGTSELKLALIDNAALGEYIVIRSETAKQAGTDAALLLRTCISELGTDLKIATDWVKKGTEPPTDTKEILVGTTNRAENPAERSLRAGDFIIKFENDRLVICGGSETATLSATEFFTEHFIDRKTGEMFVPDGGEYLYRAPIAAESFKLNGTEIYDYQVEYIQVDENSAANIEKFILDVTGFKPLEESDHKIIVRSGSKSDTCTITAEGDNIIVEGNGIMDPVFASRCFSTYLYETADLSSGNSQTVSLTIDRVSLSKDDYPLKSDILIYVSPDGNDSNDGSENSPLATLEGARLRVRETAKTTSHPITVMIRGGEYYFSENVIFSAEDSGHKLAPVTYAAAEGEDVSFIGGIKVDPTRVTKAENPEITGRMLDKDAARKLMQIDLGGLLESYHAIYAAGNPEYWSIRPITVYINESPLSHARWPNENDGSEYLTSASKIETNKDGTKNIYMDAAAIERTKLWSEKAVDDLHVLGFLAHEWTNETHKVTKLDTNTGAVTLLGGHENGYFDSISGNKRYYFLDLPEELDVPGECYVDRENLIVYFLPEENYDPDKIYVSTLIENLITIEEASNLTFDGIDIMYTRGSAISSTGAYNITVTNSTMAHISTNAASLDGTKIRFANNHIYDTATGGVSIYGGDRKTLTSGESIVENCLIHDINRDKTTYKAGINAESVGLIIRNNKLYGSVHLMIRVVQNDVLIEYNEISDCVLESSDMGAIYQGRNPAQMGTVIRYNIFRNIGSKYGAGYGQYSIYLDDGHNGAEIYGNIFQNASYDSAAIFTNGAQFSKMTNNIFINTPYAYRSSIYWDDDKGNDISWWMMLYDRRNGGEYKMIEKLQNQGFDSEIWREHYKGTIWAQLYDYIDSERIEKYASLSDDEMKKLAAENAPYQTNILSGNVMVNIGDGIGPVYDGLNCFFENNYITRDTGVFKDPGTDYTLTSEALAEIRKIAPDFQDIPLDKIGLIN